MTRSAYLAAGMASGQALSDRLLRCIVAVGALIAVLVIAYAG